MREIGGYIELDTYHLPMLHDGSVALNCGRNALAYLFKVRNIKKIRIPRFICDSVTDVCDREGVPYELYGIGEDLFPLDEVHLGEGEWLYFVNFYSQFDNDAISELVHKHGRVIVDNAQSYFQLPVPGVDTLYTCRKYFGVADGAFLYTDAKVMEELPVDESFERMRFLLGRFERTASEFYADYCANNKLFVTEQIKQMSKLTRNLLQGIDYNRVKSIRMNNYSCYHRTLKKINLLTLRDNPGTFMYPLLIENGAIIRKKLQEKKIYIPTLWPNVIEKTKGGSTENRLAKNILPLPIDQRYCDLDIAYICEEVLKCINCAS